MCPGKQIPGQGDAKKWHRDAYKHKRKELLKYTI